MTYKPDVTSVILGAAKDLIAPATEYSLKCHQVLRSAQDDKKA
jgi:hypothetical protein